MQLCYGICETGVQVLEYSKCVWMSSVGFFIFKSHDRTVKQEQEQWLFGPLPPWCVCWFENAQQISGDKKFSTFM